MQYLRDYEERSGPFVAGENDCLTFTEGAWIAMHGHGWATDWVGKYASNGRFIGRKRLIKENGFDNFLDAIDHRLKRVEYAPPFGALVAAPGRGVFGYGLGICTGHHAAVIGPNGLCRVGIEMITAAWVELEWRN